MSAREGASAYTMELRLLLCPSCGAPIDVSPNGGAVQCRFCSAQSRVAARASLAAFTAPAPVRIAEPQRMERLRAQKKQPLLPPSSLAPLFGPGGEIPAWREQDVFAAWQSARKRTEEEAFDAAEELLFLNVTLGNLLRARKDWTRHRAMLESSFEAFFLPRHRSISASELCAGACAQGDLRSGETWLALCDPASDDLHADSSYRLAVTIVAMRKHDYPAVLTALGRSGADVPVHDTYASTFAIHRAHALERTGSVDAAIRELTEEMSKGPSSRASIQNIVKASGLCEASFPSAFAAARERAAKDGATSSTLGIVFLAIGSIGFLGGAGSIMLVLGAARRNDDALAPGGVVSIVSVFFLVIGAVHLFGARARRARVDAEWKR